MAAQLRLVAHAAQREALELAPERARNRAAQRGLADARRADEAEDRTLRVAAQLHDGEEFEDALLDFFEAVVVFVEDAPRLVEVELVLGRFLPRQLKHVLKVSADDVVVGRRRRQPLHAAQLALGLFAHVVGEVGLLQALAQQLGLGALAALVLAQLLLDRLHLLAQDVVALRLVHLALRLGGDLRAQLHDLDLARQARVGDLQQVVRRVGFEHLLLLLDAEVEDRAEEVGELHGVLRGEHGGAYLRRYLGQHRQRALDQRLHVAEQRLDRLRVFRHGRRQREGARADVRVGLHPLDEADAVGAVDDELEAVGRAHHALDHDERADFVEVCGRRGLAFGAAAPLAHGDADEQLLLGRERRLDRRDRPRAPRRERDHRARKERRLLQGQHGDLEDARLRLQHLGLPLRRLRRVGALRGLLTVARLLRRCGCCGADGGAPCPAFPLRP